MTIYPSLRLDSISSVYRSRLRCGSESSKHCCPLLCSIENETGSLWVYKSCTTPQRCFYSSPVTACPVNLGVCDEVNNLKATQSLSKQSDIWNPLWPHVCSLICDGCFFFSLCLLISPQIFDTWTSGKMASPLFVVLSHILLAFLPVIIYLHPYTDLLFFFFFNNVSFSIHFHQNHLNLIAILDFAFLSPPFSPSLRRGLFFPVLSSLL